MKIPGAHQLVVKNDDCNQNARTIRDVASLSSGERADVRLTFPAFNILSIKNSTRAGFTLAEVLAALALMAIVIPVAVHGMRVASLAGVVAQRKALAARIGERLLNETVVTRQWNQSVQNGTEQAGPYQF